MVLWYVIAGIIVLTLGRKLFWLFIGIIGFFAGFEIASLFLPVDSQIIVILVGIASGLIGAVLAVILERLAFALAGFYAGGFVVLAMVQSSPFENWAKFLLLIGGIIAAILSWIYMDWAIIVLSSMAGSAMIVLTIQTEPTLAFIAFGGLWAVGMLIQGKLYILSKKKSQVHSRLQ
jgi:hypothetical protein